MIEAKWIYMTVRKPTFLEWLFHKNTIMMETVIVDDKDIEAIKQDNGNDIKYQYFDFQGERIIGAIYNDT